LLDQVKFPRSIAELGISKEDFEQALPGLVQLAFDDPAGKSNPRMPLMSELAELLRAAYQGRGAAQPSRAAQLQNA
jgi:acetaldehyde dehydrogenase/alcohol dehydrogenase